MGAATPLSLLNFSIGFTLSIFHQLANIGELPGNGRGRGHRGTDQMRATAASLAAFEVPI
jgi:hypothetical protein